MVSGVPPRRRSCKVMPNDNFIIQEAIRLVGEGVSVTLPVNGWSMRPFIIGGKESVILESPGMLKVGDVVLAMVPPGRYVVHRIIRINGERVTLMGDGNISGTESCNIGDVKARATHVADADGRLRYLYSKRRMLAARLWYWLRPLRRYLLRII